MVHYRRHRIRGGTFFFTVALANRRSTLLIDHIASLRRAFRQTRDEKPFAIDAIVVLPDHLHTIWTLPEAESDYSARWRRLKGLFTRALSASGLPIVKDKRGEYALWQRRFWEHAVRDDADLERCMDYIHFNPVKHGYVTSAIAWQASSFHSYVRAGVLPADWGRNDQTNTGNYGEPA